MAVRLLTMAPLGTALASPAFAHAFLEQADRLAGSQLKGSPSAVTMTFTAQVEPRFSLMKIRDARATRMDTGPVHRGDGKSLAVDVPLLPGGSTP
jgi:methionine-rich copper-binding protein CopC